jgi:serine/threonine-protein kinase
MLTGQLPFNASDPVELARLHRESTPVEPRLLNAAIPPALDQIIMKVLSKEPSARYRTADQLGRVLLTFSQSASAFATNIPMQFNGQAGTQSPSGHTDPVNISLPPEKTSSVTQDSPTEIDWGSIGLGMLALATVGGLIPFWLYVYFTLNPPVR